MITLIVLWYLMGYIGTLLIDYYMSNKITVGDLMTALVIGIMGPVIMLTILVILVEDTGFFDKTIIKRK